MKENLSEGGIWPCISETTVKGAKRTFHLFYVMGTVREECGSQSDGSTFEGEGLFEAIPVFKKQIERLKNSGPYWAKGTFEVVERIEIIHEVRS